MDLFRKKKEIHLDRLNREDVILGKKQQCSDIETRLNKEKAIIGKHNDDAKEIISECRSGFGAEWKLDIDIDGLIKKRTDMIAQGKIALPIETATTKYVMESVLVDIMNNPGISTYDLESKHGVKMERMLYAFEQAFFISKDIPGYRRQILFSDEKQVGELIEEVTRLFPHRKIWTEYKWKLLDVSNCERAFGFFPYYNSIIDLVDAEGVKYLSSIIHASSRYDEFAFLDFKNTGIFDVYKLVYNSHIFNEEYSFRSYFIDVLLPLLIKKQNKLIIIAYGDEVLRSSIQKNLIPMFLDEKLRKHIVLVVFTSGNTRDYKTSFTESFFIRTTGDEAVTYTKERYDKYVLIREKEKRKKKIPASEITIVDNDKLEKYLEYGYSEKLEKLMDDITLYMADKEISIDYDASRMSKTVYEFAIKKGHINPLAISYAFNVKLLVAEMIYFNIQVAGYLDIDGRICDKEKDTNDLNFGKEWYYESAGPCDIEIMEEYAYKYKPGDTALFDEIMASLPLESYISKEINTPEEQKINISILPYIETKEDYLREYLMSHFKLEYEDFCKALNLKPEMRDELTLVYRIAEDNNLAIQDVKDLISLCNYILDNFNEVNRYMLSKSSIQSLIRMINVAEYKGAFKQFSLMNRLVRDDSNYTEGDKNAYMNIITGADFEKYCADLLIKNDYINVETTKGSGDHGVDIFAEKDDITYAIQCKYYSSPVGNAAIQEAYSGKNLFHRDIAVVMTNSTFTQQARDEAKELRVKLWDGEYLRTVLDAFDLFE